MYHSKTHHESFLNKNGFKIRVHGPIDSKQLSKYTFHSELTTFRPSERQHEALIGIAKLPEARVIVALDHERIVGYITFLHPDPFERWAEIPMPDLLELGAIEVAPPYRNLGLGKEMLRVAFLDDALEDYIVISTEYYWHWDLEGTGLSAWEYRRMMEKIMSSADFTCLPTDDPDISSNPVNCLMTRIGARVPQSSIETFNQLRFASKLNLDNNK